MFLLRVLAVPMTIRFQTATSSVPEYMITMSWVWWCMIQPMETWSPCGLPWCLPFLLLALCPRLPVTPLYRFTPERHLHIHGRSFHPGPRLGHSLIPSLAHLRVLAHSKASTAPHIHCEELSHLDINVIYFHQLVIGWRLLNSWLLL